MTNDPRKQQNQTGRGAAGSGAREYLGEAYLLANEVQKAQEQLAALRQICLIPCEEYEDLEKAITAYSKRAARSR